MAMTKPAGVGVQAIGAVCFLGGLIALPQTVLGGVVVMAGGLWLLKLGRAPLGKP